MNSDKLTYEQAYKELESILAELRASDIPLDNLHIKVKRAKELLDFCKDSLRNTSETVKSLLEDEDIDPSE